MSTMFKMFVGNVAFTTSEDQLRELFSPHMPIEDVIVVRDDEGKSKGYAFVLTRDHEAGQRAVDRVRKVEFEGRRMYLKKAGDKGKRPSGGRRGGRPQNRGGRRPFRPRPPRRDADRPAPSDSSPAPKPASNPVNITNTSSSGYEGMNSD